MSHLYTNVYKCISRNSLVTAIIILFLTTPCEVIRMKNTRNIDLKIDEVLEELYHLREENQELKVENDFLQRQNNALKMRCSQNSQKLWKLESEVADLPFTHKTLLRPMTDSDIAEERFLENGVKAYEASLRLGDDF